MNVAAKDALTTGAEEYHEPTGKALEIVQPQRALTPMEMVQYAIQSGQPIDMVREMIALAKEIKREQAREAFDAAVADAKAEIPVVAKNATGHNDKRYANFAAYAATVDPIIGKHGLSYRFRTVQTDKISVTCILSHRAGHAEETTLSGPADATGSKNAIQALGSTLTYLQRYTLVQALGLAASDDDDGKSAGAAAGPVDEQALYELNTEMKRVGADPKRFCEIFEIEAMEHLPARDFKEAMQKLAEYGRKNQRQAS